MAFRHLLMTSAAALVVGAAVLLAPVHAARAQNERAGAPCSITWDEQTSGGDTETIHGEVTIAQSAPQAGGSFVAMESGHATVTYHPALAICRVVRGSPWTATFEVTMMSQDGQTAEIDIASMDEPHTITESCGDATFDVDPHSPPTLTVPLREGTTPFSYSHGAGAHRASTSGSVTLHYCPSPAH